MTLNHQLVLGQSTFPTALARPGMVNSCQFYSPGSAEFNHVPIPDSLHDAAQKRQVEYRAGRYCAYGALETLGEAPCYPAIARSGAPIWPKGVVASLSHSHGKAVCVAARTESFRGVGVDIEPVISDQVAHKISRKIAHTCELGLLTDTFGLGCAITIIFCAKESIYKAIFSTVKRYVDFHEMELDQICIDGLIFRPAESVSRLLPHATSLYVSFVVQNETVLALCSYGDTGPKSRMICALEKGVTS